MRQHIAQRSSRTYKIERQDGKVRLAYILLPIIYDLHILRPLLFNT